MSFGNYYLNEVAAAKKTHGAIYGRWLHAAGQRRTFGGKH